ncbi:asparagine synthase (glutamine-hydrolyzing) [Thermaerobacter marianensis DSM 12885]|uniref:asparagine synthase (glutamine-hydrolyzing) n=1 Tax=Thermaerobacter marianensis (strain ATCC 700841 / DSM 12885 / JCM 10246 / 7p75a) TaxID=644966 RepID=E6SHQ1_THEM7|nr:asparagine synthase (glutamine-hydrolyzing) [Thermaerobacter marianensis]ADU50748.1 asparagine synthase (glutamine-hydrolyzing) [Thermaerobacter marianensis DSM 12885]
MCGIAGWIDWERDLTREGAVLKAMTGTLACRGPDDHGYWISRHAAIGHRRLIVIDPAGGAQPMVRERGGTPFVLSYNGELYNTAELRRELESLGYTFRTRSDTEVVLLAYLAWGVRAPERLNGIFAFAVWDEAGQRLFLARDRLGVKPLFYVARGPTFLFGSEPKALLAHPEVEPVVDAEGLVEIFAVGPARTPGHGVFRDVRELLPGHYLVWDRQGLHHGCYWRLESRPHADPPAETVATVRELLADAARRQLVSDVPICTLLSGGLDSSAITAFAARAVAERGQGPLRTYSVDYAGNERFFRPDDFQPEADAPYVALMVRTLGTDHRVVRITTEELVEALPRAVTARDLPGMADIDASLLLFCREIKQGATVALSGECADEVFCGYPWFYRPDALEARTFPWSLKVDARLQVLDPGLRAALRPEEYLADRYQQALAEVPRLDGEEPAAARRREIAYLTLTRWMPVLLDRKDRMSMAVGLEVRVPFCDHRLVEYVWNVPWELKTMGGREKGLLRHALAGVLPEQVLWRKKSPYPKTFNPAYLAAMRAWVQSILDDPASPLRPLVDPAAVRALVRAEGEFDIPWFGQLMRRPQLLAYLAQVDLWLRKYKVRVAV